MHYMSASLKSITGGCRSHGGISGFRDDTYKYDYIFWKF